MHNAIITNMKELDFADTVPVSKNSVSSVVFVGVSLPLLAGLGLVLISVVFVDVSLPLLAGLGLVLIVVAGLGEDTALNISTVKLFAAIVAC
jgi:hypothetical protein